jgi:hypothetical protein
MLSSAALLSGCVAPASNYCTLAHPILFGSQQTVDWLASNDERMLTDVIVHNEQVSAICKG